MDHTTISLKPTGDYGFGLTLGYLRTSPSAILEHLTDTGFSRALDIGQGVVISVERDGLLPSDDPLLLTIWSEKLSPDLIDITVRHVRRMLTLDVDGSMIERLLLQRDSVTGRYATSYHGFRPILLGTPWEAFLWAVCGQLIDAQQAKVIRTRLVKLGDRRLMVGDREYALPPSPDWIARQDCGSIRSIGLSRAKAEAILQAARAIVAGTIPWSVYPRLAHSDTLTRLEAMPGVGPWTTAIRGSADSVTSMRYPSVTPRSR